RPADAAEYLHDGVGDRLMLGRAVRFCSNRFDSRHDDFPCFCWGGRKSCTRCAKRATTRRLQTRIAPQTGYTRPVCSINARSSVMADVRVAFVHGVSPRVLEAITSLNPEGFTTIAVEAKTTPEEKQIEA